MKFLRVGALALLLSGAVGCSRAVVKDDPWETGTVTLVVSEKQEVSEVVFERNGLVRVDHLSQDAEFRKRVQARVDELIARGRREGLDVKYHDDSAGRGERGPLVGGSPKPGEPQFARAMYEHLGTERLSVRAK